MSSLFNQSTSILYKMRLLDSIEYDQMAGVNFTLYRDPINPTKTPKRGISMPMEIDSDDERDCHPHKSTNANDTNMVDALPMSTYVDIKMARIRHEAVRKALRGKLEASKKKSLWA